MKPKRIRPSLYAALILAYLLHNDLWLWHDSRLFFGLPVGLLYHIGFCLAVAGLMALLALAGWPAEIERQDRKADP